MGVTPLVDFRHLLSAALEQRKPEYVTDIPKCLLDDQEKNYIKFIDECLEKQFIPTIDTFRTQKQFLPVQSEVPIEEIYNIVTKDMRERYIQIQMLEFVAENRRNNLPDFHNVVDYQLKLIEKTAIRKPEVIEYNSLSREQYMTNVYRSQYYLPFFDDMTQGLNGGDFIVIFAGTKGYKTTLLKLLAQAALESKAENILVASQEQSVLSFAQQFDTLALGESHAKLRRGIDPEMMAKIKKVEARLRKYPNKMYITPQITTVGQLHAHITSLNLPTDKPIRKVFIDGLNLMQGDAENSYTSLMKVCADLKAYAIKYNLIIIAVTQANREGYKAGTGMSASHIAGSFAIGMYADLLLGLSQIEENNKKMIYIRPILNRHGDDSVKILLNVHYSPDGKIDIELHQVDPNYDPDNAQISQQVISKAKADFEKETGVSFNELASQLGQKESEEILKVVLAESEKPF